MIAIIDYDAGNIASVKKAFEYLGKQVILTREPREILSANHVVLPGVGAYADCMNKLNTYHLVEPIHEVVRQQIPFLGICLGLQLMFDESEENGPVKGLSLVPGNIIRIPNTDGLKIPHIGWNSLKIKEGTRLFQGIDSEAYVYFVHSYYLKAKDENIVAATTEYGAHIHAAIEKDNLFACQFHPEKSGEVGLQILKNFASI